MKKSKMKLACFVSGMLKVKSSIYELTFQKKQSNETYYAIYFSLNIFSMNYILPLILLIIGSSCKELSVDDISVDNYEKILEKSEEHSLDKYTIGLNDFSYVMPPRIRALEIEELSFPWEIHKTASDDKVRRGVLVRNVETNENHMLNFVNNELVHVSFEKLSDQRFAKYLQLLSNYGYTYKKSEYREKDDVLVKRLDRNLFVIVINDLDGDNRLIFDIYEKK